MKAASMLGFDGAGRPLRLDPKDRQTHMHVIGSSGSGKSKFLEHLMRQDLEQRQGFCLIDPEGTLYNSILSWAGRRGLDREIIPLNMSDSGAVIGFNPFERAPGDAAIDVQVDHRIEATLHAWNVKNTEETPTLARTLRLIYTVMLERNIGLPQSSHLINFDARDIREELITNLPTPLIEREWRELQDLKARDFRQEVLSAKNKLFKFLTSPTIGRFMGIPGRSIDLADIIEQQKILLVNLAPSDHLSEDNARAVGALLVNEFREVAIRRKPKNGALKPYYLYIDEFQDFVSLDITNMLDRIRKRGLFLVLAHQRFGQLDENIIDAVLTNCRIKAVFGGLPVPSARRMAEELFIGKLDPMLVKAAIYQTKFWPKYTREKVYTHATGRTTTTGHTSMTGGAEGSTASTAESSSTGYFYDNWFSIPQLYGTRREMKSNSEASASSRSNTWSEATSDSESYSENDSVADIPFLQPVPFEELSSVQFMPLEEQLHQMTAALKQQFPRHCFIQVHNQDTQPLLIPNVEDLYISEERLNWYRDYHLNKNNALPPMEIDRLLEQQEAALLQAPHITLDIHTDPPSAQKQTEPTIEAKPTSPPRSTKGRKKPDAEPPPLWDR